MRRAGGWWPLPASSQRCWKPAERSTACRWLRPGRGRAWRVSCRSASPSWSWRRKTQLQQPIPSPPQLPPSISRKAPGTKTLMLTSVPIVSQLLGIEPDLPAVHSWEGLRLSCQTCCILPFRLCAVDEVSVHCAWCDCHNHCDSLPTNLPL